MNRRPQEIQATLFDTPPAYVRPKRTPVAAGELKGMVRHPDHDTSILAAESARERKERVKNQIYQALLDRGPMTDGELSQLFPKHPVSSIAKRRGDLTREDPPRVIATDARRGHPLRPDSMMIVWRAVR